MTSHPSAIMSRKESFMNCWNIAGELVSPKHITVGSKRPLCVIKAAFHWWPSLMQMLLYPQQTSNLVNSLASLSMLMRSEMSGSG